MSTAKVAVTLDAELLREVDSWVRSGEFPNRSRAIQSAVLHLRAERGKRASLLRELAKLNPHEEKAMAEEWFQGEADWPAY